MTLNFPDARASVLRRVTVRMDRETVPLVDAAGRILAEEARADRDFPALDRSVRDGFAIRTADLPGPVPVTGELRAGDPSRPLPPGEAFEIMTGAPIPSGADAVVMVEHAIRRGNLVEHAPVMPGTFLSRQGEEARAGQVLINVGTRLDYSGIALLAASGHATVSVFRKPIVAILATGDELVPVDQAPLPHQIRNSNAYSLAAQVTRAGGIPKLLAVARDEERDTRERIEEGLHSDLLLLSGGVSAGKFDFVEQALASLDAEFYFDRVQIQPGAPVVFGRSAGRFFFGLPGNPASTMVTFEVFARAALELLGGLRESVLPIAYGRLTVAFRQKPGLTRFLPALISGSGELTPVPWKGSSDVPAVSRANAFLMTDPERTEWAAGEFLPLLLK
ncbi:MAG: molybdopterin molybdotransferase MoeA [Acidobacteriota bacterium]|nr:molybdopterin molybdotransferase MoeA [Acidobacteriota bacterium]